MQEKEFFQEKITRKMPLIVKRKWFSSWRKGLKRRNEEFPRGFYRLKLMKKMFDEWKTLPRELQFDRVVKPLLTRNSCKEFWWQWRRHFLKCRRFRRVLSLLSRMLWRNKVKEAFLQWPGRDKIVKAEELRRRIVSKGGGNRIRLVDVEESAPLGKGKGKDKPATRIVCKSFLRRAPRSIVDLAVSRGYLKDGREDQRGLQRIYELLQAVLSGWSGVVARERQLRVRAMRVKGGERKKSLKEAMRQWVALTPRVSYRVVTWINNNDKGKGEGGRDILLKGLDLDLVKERDLLSCSYEEFTSSEQSIGELREEIAVES